MAATAVSSAGDGSCAMYSRGTLRSDRSRGLASRTRRTCGSGLEGLVD